MTPSPPRSAKGKVEKCEFKGKVEKGLSSGGQDL